MTEIIGALRGALKYVRTYRGQTFVVKVGGKVIDSAQQMDNLAQQLALMDSLSIRVVLVHGGGPQASRVSRKLGIEPEVVAGRRVTNRRVLDVAKMVYAGQMNTDVLCAMRAHQVRAVGVSGIDGDLVIAERRPPQRLTDDGGVEREVNFGEVGDVVAVDVSLLNTLLDAGYLPVVSSLAADDSGAALNINADSLAEALACALAAEKLIFLTSAAGLLRDAADPSTLVSFADPDELDQLVAEGAVKGGMRPKLEACKRAVRGGVRRTHIIDGREPNSLLMEVFTGAGCGTMIVEEREKDAYSQNEL